jgi:UDP-glucuronate decarboxylase
MVDGLIRMMEPPAEVVGPINLCNRAEFTIRALAEKVLRFTESRSKQIFMPLPPDGSQQRQPNIDRAKDKLGWRPTVSMDDGLKETTAYFTKFAG